MASIINTNINSLTAQRNLSMNQASLAASMQRLSSGLRINSAKDDAAGLAISERFTTQIRGLNQAARNANDGISLSQTAEGALGEITNNLQRIRELAVQSANSTNSASDRAALDQEVQQRIAEVDRVASQSSFNGQKILDGTFGAATFQVGANVGDTIGVNLSGSMRLSSVGQIATTTSSGIAAVIGSGAALSATPATTGSLGFFTDSTTAIAGHVFTFTVAGVSVYTRTSPSGWSSVTAADIDGALGNSTVQSNLAAAGITVSGSASGGNLAFTRANGANFSVTLTDTSPFPFTGSFAAGNVTTTNGVPPSVVPLAPGDLSIQVGNNAAVGISGTFATLGALAAEINSKTAGNAFATISPSGELLLESGQNLTISGANTHGLATSAVSGGLDTVNVLNVSASNTAIQRIDSALTSVSTLRSTFGAIQNRFESVISSLGATAENLTASRSRVQDADFAAETANLSRSQILQQAGTAMVAQANQLPQGVLQLLK